METTGKSRLTRASLDSHRPTDQRPGGSTGPRRHSSFYRASPTTGAPPLLLPHVLTPVWRQRCALLFAIVTLLCGHGPAGCRGAPGPAALRGAGPDRGAVPLRLPPRGG